MPQERTDSAAASAAGTSPPARPFAARLHGIGPVVGLVLLCIAGALLNSDFATLDNAMNVLTRTAFIGIIAVGMCFVIICGGIDLSVGFDGGADRRQRDPADERARRTRLAPVVTVVLGAGFAVLLGALFGLAHGLLITRGRIEPFIVTLGTLGIFRAYLTYLVERRRDHARQHAGRRLCAGLLRRAARRAGPGLGVPASSRCWAR